MWSCTKDASNARLVAAGGNGSAHEVMGYVHSSTGEYVFKGFFDNIGIGVSYEWDFGDGTTSIVENPTHQYTDAGVYDLPRAALFA